MLNVLFPKQLREVKAEQCGGRGGGGKPSSTSQGKIVWGESMWFWLSRSALSHNGSLLGRLCSAFSLLAGAWQLQRSIITEDRSGSRDVCDRVTLRQQAGPLSQLWESADVERFQQLLGGGSPPTLPVCRVVWALLRWALPHPASLLPPLKSCG